MKHNLLASPAKLTVISALCLFCFTGSICDPVDAVDDSPCGEEVYWSAFLDIPSETDWIFGFDGVGNRTITLVTKKAAPEDMCADEHIKVTFSALFALTIPSDEIKAYGIATWSLFGRTRLLPGTTGREITEEIGLKQAFGSDPGYIFPEVQFVFPSKGGSAIDSLWLDDRLVSTLVEIQYKKYKAK